MHSISYTPKQNLLLAALSTSDYERLLPSLELLSLPVGLGVHEAGSTQSEVYFPTDSIISLVYVMANGVTTEFAMVGNDGLVGVSLLMGGLSTPNHAVVRNAGHAYRINYRILKTAISNSVTLRNTLLLYTQSLITQIAQNSACTRHHTIEQRLCRWLLMSFDLIPLNNLTTTHAQIANMLGVRRELVTTTAGNLQKDGLIRYSRGHITALDRPKLKKRVCECYAAIKRETNRLTQTMPSDRPLVSRHFPPAGKTAANMY